MTKAIWTVWKHALGSFSDEQTAGRDDIICVVRTFLVSVNLLTCLVIVVNVVHNW